MEESAYWNRFWRRRINRRRLLTGAALAGSGLAAAAVVGCGGASTGTNPGDTGGGSAADDLLKIKAQEPADGRQVFTPATADSRGGSLVYIGFDAVVLDRYDPHQTQFGPMYSNQSAIFSKLYRYASHEEPTWENILPDLAESAPEMVEPAPETMTYIIHLRKGVKFHNSEMARNNFPNVAGRELTADDVIYSYNRQRNPASKQHAYYYRSSQYGTIDTIEATDKYTIKIKTKGPVAPFYHFMADTNAMIIPPEVVDMEPAPGDTKPWDSVDAYGDRQPKPEGRMIGTGPFMWDTLKFGIEFTAVRNPEWFGWDQPELGRPYLDAYTATGQGLNDATVESLFRQKKIDTAGFIDNPQWIVNIKNEHPELTFQRDAVSGWVNTRLKTQCKPFDDWRVRRALHLAVDRQQVVDVIGSGAWIKVGPVGQAVKYWALPEDELLALPGYRFGGPERDQDIKDARQLYEAAGSPQIPQIWFADVPDYIRRFATTYIQTIKNNLGITSDIKFQTVPYSRIAEGLVKDECDQGSMTWGFDNGWVDLDDWVYPYFKTGGPKNSFKVSDPDLDLLLDAQRREFDHDKRLQLGYQIQRYILGIPKQDTPVALARIEYAAPGGGSIAWPYLKNRSSFPWFGNQYWAANIWIDKNDASYQGRPSK